MIEKETVLILGAGASAPYGYPTGKELRNEIRSKFQGNLYQFLRHSLPHNYPDSQSEILIKNEIAKAKDFCEKFFKSGNSIDLFLSRNKQFIDMGKRAIILHIFSSEINSGFREESKKPEHDWYSYLFDRMTNHIIKPDDIDSFRKDNRISFITFNYDRSLEQFLYENLCNSFTTIPPDKITLILNQLKIVHIYGQVAKLDWQDRNEGIPYKKPIVQMPDSILNNIKVILEERPNSNNSLPHHLKDAHDLIKKAESLFFLGFGYAKENLDILNVPEIIKQKTEVFGTAVGLSEKEIQDIRQNIISGLKIEKTEDQILGKNGGRIHIENKDCLMILKEHL